jgi:ureidoacrylate peracid hydrolase
MATATYDKNATAWRSKSFEHGTWGGEIRSEFAPHTGEIVVQEHWGSSGFANTDLDLQLTRHGIHQLIVIGLIAHTCVEATALDVNLPNYAAVVTTNQMLDSISSLKTSGIGAQ